ncbi:MAG: TRAP transporter large permease subunit [Verrucomicrobiales bacterium]|nr:TRAP transporter large permease subunit [Verrucomicrobiales bacterium]MCP5525411.1 TRAP transporter large permease subunit [Verrucomicrobiales bacterium]
MSVEVPFHEEVAPEKPRWLHWGCGVENLFVVLALAAMVLLPVSEIVLRKFFATGVPASVPLVQHLVLAVGMLGGAVAAREGRLLAISTLTTYLKGRWKQAAGVVANSVGAAISLLLGLASWQFVMSSRRLGKELAHGIPVWVVQLLLVVGFVVIAARLVWHAGATWRGRVAALVIGGALVGVGIWQPVDPERLRLPALVILLLATLLGAPIFTTIGGAAIILLAALGEPPAAVPLNHYRLTTEPTLPAIPLFTLAGYFLAEGGAAKRLVRVFRALFGSIRGGPAVATVLLCAFFTSFTGASGVTILALGGLLMPVLVAAGYPERTALGLLTAAGSLGLLFPPCLPPILFSIVASSSTDAQVSMEQVFQGGLAPGLLLMGLVAGWAIWQAPGGARDREPFVGREVWGAIWEAKWELLIPVVALTALFSGIATPVEAAAITAFYAFVTEVVIYRDLHLFRDVPRVMTECGLLVGGVLLILGVALGFTYFLIDSQVPDLAVEWVTAHISSKLVFLLVVNVLLILVGCLMDIYSAIVVVVPLLVPLGRAYGIDMVHLGIIFLANLELGYLTPPVGMNLFLSSYRFQKPIPEVIRASFPMLVVLFVGVLLITYLPFLTTALPAWLAR